MYKFIVGGIGENYFATVAEYDRLIREIVGDDGQTQKIQEQFGKLRLKLFVNKRLAYWRCKLAAYKHSSPASDGAGRLTDARHIVEIRRLEDEAKIDISKYNAEIVAIPRADRVAAVKEDVRQYMIQHGADQITAHQIAETAITKYPTDAEILESTLKVAYYEIDDGCNTVTPAEIQQALAETLAVSKIESQQVLYDLYLGEVLRFLISGVAQSVKESGVIGNQTHQKFDEACDALAGANATMFGNPIPEISCFLDHFAPKALVDNTFMMCSINGIVRFYYEHGMKGYLPLKDLAEIGYCEALLDDTGTNPFGRATFAEQLADLG